MRAELSAALLLLAALLPACRNGEAAPAAAGAADGADGPARPPAAGAETDLAAEIDPDARRVSGRHGAVRFVAEREGDAGARARYWIEDGPEVTASIEGPRTGELLWRGHHLRGGPPLPPDAAAALDELTHSPLATALAAIPLDLACRPRAEELDPSLGAALLLPWQMVLAYATDDVSAAVRESAGGSKCGHFRGPSEPGSPDRVPSPAIVALSFEAPLPVALGYFPFELEAQP
jgi:hypothetical protein